MRDPCENVYSVTQQWRSQDLEVGGHRGLRDGSPSAGSRVRAPGGRMGFRGLGILRIFGCQTIHNFVCFVYCGHVPPLSPVRPSRGNCRNPRKKIGGGVGYRIILAEQITLECVFQLHSTFRN